MSAAPTSAEPTPTAAAPARRNAACSLCRRRLWRGVERRRAAHGGRGRNPALAAPRGTTSQLGSQPPRRFDLGRRHCARNRWQPGLAARREYLRHKSRTDAGLRASRDGGAHVVGGAHRPSEDDESGSSRKLAIVSSASAESSVTSTTPIPPSRSAQTTPAGSATRRRIATTRWLRIASIAALTV